MREAHADWEERFDRGREGERKVSAYMRHVRGWSVMPVVQEDQAPGVFIPGLMKVTAPDQMVMSLKGAFWAEVKTKERFTWRWTKRIWQTGIDGRNFEHYLIAQSKSPLPLWLFFLHGNPVPHQRDRNRGCPDICPTGLYAREIRKIIAPTSGEDHWDIGEDHWDGKQGRGGMYYWNIENLWWLASYEDVNAAYAQDLLRKPIRSQA